MNPAMLDSVRHYSHSKHSRRAQSARKMRQKSLLQKRLHSKPSERSHRTFRAKPRNPHRERKAMRQCPFDLDSSGYESPSDLDDKMGDDDLDVAGPPIPISGPEPV